MTSAERKLLLMVAKDMRRLWSERMLPTSYAVAGKRVKQYDGSIFDVEDVTRTTETQRRRYWEVIVLTTSSTRADLKGEFFNGWYQLFFYATTKDHVDLYVQNNVDSFERFFVCEIGSVPKGTEIVEI